MNLAPRTNRLAALLLLATWIVCCTGCSSTKAASSAGFASVVISGNTPGQIRNAAVDVFYRAGYTATEKDPGNLVFEKKGSGMNDFAYGDWLGDNPVWVRVKATVVLAGEMRCRLECRPFIVRDRGHATEEEIPISKIHKGRYQKLLDEVAKSLAKK